MVIFIQRTKIIFGRLINETVCKKNNVFDNEHYSMATEKRIMNREELLKVLRLMLLKLVLSIIAACILTLSLTYVISNDSLYFMYIFLPVLAFVLIASLFYFLAKALILDFYHQEKLIETKTLSKKPVKLTKEMETPVAARCTQKQSFGVNADKLPGELEVLIGNENFTLSKQLYDQVADGDEVLLHRALRSRTLFKIEKKYNKET